MSPLKDFAHLRIPLEEIKSATDNFANEHIIERGGSGKVYKGQLLQHGQLIDIAIKRSDLKHWRGKKELWTDIAMLSSLKHINIVSIVGFCDEAEEKIIIYKYEVNGSLDKYLSDPTLTWLQRLHICIGVARALSYIHYDTGRNYDVIHRDIKTSNIMLDGNWDAKLSGFGLSLKVLATRRHRLVLDAAVGPMGYADPVYMETGTLTHKSDVYSFGVVLFEVLCGRRTINFKIEDERRFLAPMATSHYEEGKLEEIIDPNLRINQMHPEAFKIFSETAYHCLKKQRAQRPDMEKVAKRLEKAWELQREHDNPAHSKIPLDGTSSSNNLKENNKDKLKISLEDIRSATQNFSDSNLIGRGNFGNVYKGEVIHANGHHIIAAKRLDRDGGQGEPEFLKELEVLLEYKNDNVIGLVGYCDEMGEKIIVYEYAARNSLDRHLSCIDFTWMQRLKVCIDVASGLEFLHGGVVTQEVVIHRDIRSSKILLTNDWKAKISDFGLSLISPKIQEMDYIIDDARGTYGYIDPQYNSSGFLSKESDIYSLGVVLFEILCGILFGYDSIYLGVRWHLSNLAKSLFDEGKLKQIVFKGIRDQIVPESFTAYSTIAYQCLHDVREKRPTISEVLVQLKKALEFQEDYEIWEPKLPRDYKEIIQMSKYPEIFSAKSNKDLFDMFSKGILLQEGKVWFSLGANGERNEMISAREFSYKNRRSHKWRSILETRFEKVAEMLDISKLKTQIKITTRFLSPGVNYGVYLVFKFCIPRTVSSTPMYVNLTYKRGNETLHSYFATWRDDGWMMIELCRFLTHKEEAHIEILLESFSRYYCKSGAIYIEGIEFRAIDDVKHEDIEKLKEVQLPPSTDEVQQSSSSYKEISTASENYDEGEKLLSLDEMNKKKSHMLSARDALYDSSNVKLFTLKPSADSRFKEVIEFLSQQVLHIKCKIGRQMLSPNTAYMCYLVFKLSEKGCGLNCPVIVRDLLKWKNKETEVVYFRSPSPLNCHHGNRVPEKREDGWMEVNVWEFNSNEFKNDSLPTNLKLICYEGTMSGLIVHGLEFRPV